MTSLWGDPSQAVCLEELLILDSVHEVVKVVGNRDRGVQEEELDY